ncbi:MAG: penicillin-binding protein activator [Gammaproteobacteria bacterium]|nr:penicillin-binding protein activator [Gammaproteobacteria bacterium]
MNLYLSLFLFILLAGCAQKPQLSKTIPPAPAVTIEKELTSQTKQLTESQTETLKDYIQRSEANPGPLRQQYILEMSEWLYEQLELKAALRALDKLQPEYLTLRQSNRAFLLKSRIMLSQGDYTGVIKTLPSTLVNLNNQQKIDVLNLRAQAFLGASYPFEAIRTRIKLSAYLHDELAIDDNQYTIWRILNLMSLNSLKQINTLPLNSQLKGWIELAIVTKNNQNNWQRLEDVYQDWLQNNPQHPAGRTFLATLAKNQIELIKQPRHIALLLPLNDKFAGAARAIRDGFLSTHFHAQRRNQAQISVIDTSKSQTSIWQHYQTAIQKGADFIVGPLAKASIDELSKIKELEVPVLTLNYAEQQSSVTDNLFQFGLLPEDEAGQIAELAIKQGKKHAAILVPASAWGQRLQSAFQHRFEELGGEARSIKTYQSQKNDFSNSITTLLNLTQSNQRVNKIRQLLGNNIKSEAYRRRDIDMIFIAGQPRAARSILPQLKFHQASDLQVYSTSHAFSGTPNKSADRDINQLLYCDIPWVLEDNEIKSRIEKNWPESSKRYSRLYALGADAYHLIPYLGRLKARAGENFSGYTGNLYLDPLLRIHRKLISAQFIEGLPVPLAADDNMSSLYQHQTPASPGPSEQNIN